MIVLDTNVLSELMRSQPDQKVIAWFDAQDPNTLSVSVITVGEILYGIARLPEGKRKRNLASIAKQVFDEDFADRVLSLDNQAIGFYVDFLILREKLGNPISMVDAQIAAICQSYQASLATRNTKDFSALGLPLINPWEM